jgi:glycosyltransferase involved in cell wall biosynthesis/acetyltransferase-like isoleucine patch superfamily enzyme
MNELKYQFRYALPIWFLGLLTNWWPDNRVTIRLRGFFFRPFFKKCGKGFTLAKRVDFLNVHGIEIGERVYIATGAWIDGMGGVRINEGVKISPYVVIASSSHCFKDGFLLLNASRSAPIIIGKGSWLSSHVVIAAGTTVGEGCLIAANAVVVKDIPDHTMVGGVPGKVIGPVPELPPNVSSRFEKTVDTELPTQAATRKICFISPFARTLWLFYRELIQRLLNQGYKVVILSNAMQELTNFKEQLGCEIIPFEISRKISPFRDIRSIYELAGILRRGKFEMVHAHTPKGGLIGVVAAVLSFISIRVYTAHGAPIETARGLKKKLLWLSEWVTCFLATRVLAVSPSLRNRMIETRVCSAQKIRVLGEGTACGIDLGKFHSDEMVVQAGVEIRKKNEIPSDCVVIGFVGRIIGEKGIRLLVKAFERIYQGNPNVRLLLVGEMEKGHDPLDTVTMCTIRNHPAILYHPYTEEIVPFYSAMDFIVLPTQREGFGLVILEAAVLGLPSIATRVTGCVDAIVDGQTGILVDPNDEEGLLAAMNQLVNDPEMRKKMGETARKRVHSNFSSDYLISEHLKFYDGLVY